MNDIMSFGIHRLWKKYYVDLLLDKFNKKEKILDIASGSGDIFQLFPYKSNLYAIDPIDQMHEISKEKKDDLINFFDTLEEDDDVQNVYSNVELVK